MRKQRFDFIFDFVMFDAGVDSTIGTGYYYPTYKMQSYCFNSSKTMIVWHLTVGNISNYYPNLVIN